MRTSRIDNREIINIMTIGWIVVLIALAAALTIVTRKMLSLPGDMELYPYQRLTSLLSPAERSFFLSLEHAVGDCFKIFAKVRVADVVTMKPLPRMSLPSTALTRIAGHQFDFVLCQNDGLAIVGVVELDDQTADQRIQHSRDGFLIGLCRSVGLPLVHIRVQPFYPREALRALIFESLNMTPPPVVAVAEVPDGPGDTAPLQTGS